MLVYDIEIIKGILGKGEQPLPDIEYCDGWKDHKNMGISVVGVYDYVEDRYRVFLEDNFPALQALINERKVIVGFNNRSFDDAVMRANGFLIPEERSYDILVEVWRGVGLGPDFSYPSHLGYGLEAICAINFGMGKSGHGAHAPIQWQRGNYGDVIDYCINDVRITKTLLDRIIGRGSIINPKNPRTKIPVAAPPFNLST